MLNSKFLRVIIRSVFFLIITFNMIILSSTKSYAFVDEGEGGTYCKWGNQYCPNDHEWREVCHVDGDGNYCTCGEVSRMCQG